MKREKIIWDRETLMKIARLLIQRDPVLQASDVLGVTVSDRGEIRKEIIREHPEYARFQPGEEIQTEDGETVNPHLHITVETVVQTQLAKGKPPEVQEAYLTLLGEGLGPHEARHAIGYIFIEMVWRMLRRELSTDLNSYYRSQLKELILQKLKHRIFT